MQETNLHFGTSGIREKMGRGSACLNLITIEKITTAFAVYILERHLNGVVICYDNRANSKKFASKIAQVLASHNIIVFITPELRPVPYLCFVVKDMNASFGIMITASHNSKEYNGYKIYESDGSEIKPYIEREIERYLLGLTDSITTHKPFLQPENITMIDLYLMDQKYFDCISKLCQSPQLDLSQGSSLKIIYSSLHGTGITLIPNALKKLGFTSLRLVEDECIVDEGFGDIIYPNPEVIENYKKGVKLLLDDNADIFLLNDADADRIGLAVNHHGKVRIFNGNEIAIVCFYYLTLALKQKKLPLENFVVISSYVTTRMLDIIADYFGIISYKVHTGFKYIADKINQLECNQRFLFGAEESYGFLLGEYIRDKDGIAAACFLSEIALVEKVKGFTLIDFLYSAYKHFGVYRERQYSLSYNSRYDLDAHATHAMNAFRSFTIGVIASDPVDYIEDFENLTALRPSLESEKIIGTPCKAIRIHLHSGATVLLRPSGTEAKLRIHISFFSSDVANIDSSIAKVDSRIGRIFEHVKELIKL